MGLTPASIARVLAAPVANVERNWPLVLAALDQHGILSPAVEIAAAATIGVETPRFEPIRELSPKGEDRTAYFLRIYWDRPGVRHNLGNLTPADAALYFGRGFIQITGRSNYDLYGGLLGIDLIKDPDRALDAEVAAQVLALFFLRNRVHEAASAGDWKRVRLRVNGGLNNWDRFVYLVTALQKEAA